MEDLIDMDNNFLSDNEPLLSIIIVNYNGKHFIDNCLQSIEKHVPCKNEVIIVDNASTDGSIEHIVCFHPNVVLIKSDLNLGFTGGNNLGAKYAKGKYLLLLNNDTVINSTVQPLIDLLSSDINIGAIGCKLIYGDGRQQESIGYIPTPLSLVLSWTPLAKIFHNIPIFRRTVWAGSPLYREKMVKVPWVSGAFLLTPHVLWKQLDGLDESYFMYMEDTDYCRRLGEIDRLIIYSSLCEVIHYEGAGRPWVGERALLNTTDSYLVYVKKFYGAPSVYLFRTLLVPLFFARSLFFYIIRIFKNKVVNTEKSSAYWHAMKKLLFQYSPKNIQLHNKNAQGKYDS